MASTTQTKPMPDFKRKKHSLEAKQSRYGYIFTLPFVIGCILFVGYPLVLAILYSFSDVTFVPGEGLSMSNFGMQNYHSILFEDIDFKTNLVSSLGDMLLNVVTVVIFAFFMASVLNTKFFGRGFARSVMFLPVIVSSGVAAALTSNDLAGSLMSGGDKFGATGGEQVTSTFGEMLLEMGLADGLVSFITTSVDRIGTITTLAAVSIVLFISGLQSISSSVYEAAYMEGATPWETFWKISLPMVSPVILVSVVYTVIDSFTSDTNAVIYTIHHNITNKGEYAIASAMAIVYTLIILAILGIVFAVLSKIIFYQD